MRTPPVLNHVENECAVTGEFRRELIRGLLLALGEQGLLTGPKLRRALEQP